MVKPLDLSALSGWAPELAQTFVNLSSDIALVLDDDGVIRSVSQGGAVQLGATQDWVGQPWANTATGDTRAKIGQLLEEVTATGVARRREINHPAGPQGQVSIAYRAMRLGQDGPLLAIGHDLAATSAIQQKFLRAQEEMERGYWRARQAETRYRLLFQVATDGVLVVDAQTLQILEANHAAAQMFELPVEQVLGRAAGFGFEQRARAAVESLLATARASGEPAEIRARLRGKTTSTSVVATPFRSDDQMRLLMRVRAMDVPGSSADLNATLARLVDGASDGVVVTDSAGRILVANPAFLKLARMNTEAEVARRPLMDWIGVSNEQFAEMLDQVRRQGVTRRVASRLLSSDARLRQIELSAAVLTEGDQECIGFTLHLANDPGAPVVATGGLAAELEQLCARLGSAPLAEMLGQAAELTEGHLVSLALQRCEGDASAAARLLGVDRARLDRWIPKSDGSFHRGS
ncbi:transcriptional regulator PpsR [Ramlibacter sp.]|uniref:transcriptional regulator PpsR n=1 Tax=Ramlibacter sp. TaxID=1917967 RepID=UPI003D0DBB57